MARKAFKPKVIVVGPDEIRKSANKSMDLDGYKLINTTSRSTEWSGLSPFFAGPCHLYGNVFAHNVENAWQYSKVYKQHIDKSGNPNAEWFKWSQAGFLNPSAVRYPTGKGAKPEYSYWDGDKLDLVSARLAIYIPAYQKAVRSTEAFWKLHRLSRREALALWCFDGYYDPTASWMQLVNNKKRSLGHSFVLQMMLMVSPFFTMEDLK